MLELSEKQHQKLYYIFLYIKKDLANLTWHLSILNFLNIKKYIIIKNGLIFANGTLAILYKFNQSPVEAN